MSTEQIKELLAKLQKEIHNTKLDDETRSLVRQLDTDIHSVLAEDADEAEAGSVLTRAKALEANFATEHPAAERFMRELIDVLVRMGI
jgi:hypothetical protein